MNRMGRNGKVYFPKINGTMPSGKRLEVIVNGERVYMFTVQINAQDNPTHYRIIGSKIGKENIAYRINDSENYEIEAQDRVSREIRDKFQGAEIEVIEYQQSQNHKSYSTKS
ncbi:MAG: hypothetical protein WDZ69_01380 [Candidatus Pacearchaeota archaeon]